MNPEILQMKGMLAEAKKKYRTRYSYSLAFKSV